LWALATQIGFYIALLDFGMTGAMARILIDYKDDRRSPQYMRVVHTGIIVNVVQGLLILGTGAAVAFLLAPILGVPVALQRSFCILVLGQSGVLAANFIFKIFGQILTAHQRSDIINYSQVLGFLFSFVVLWMCFAAGMGVYSIIGANAAGLASGALVLALACARQSLLPTARIWRGFDRAKFRELFDYGKDVFLFSLGSHLINTSQVMVVSGTLGLEAAALWSICTRAYTMMCQIIWRGLEMSAAPLCEMVVRGEQQQLLRRFRDVTMLSTSLAVLGAALFVVGNQPFVDLWTHGRFGWSVWTDALLGVWAIAMTVQRCHTSLLGMLKSLRVVKYIYFLEGTVFVLIATLAARVGGFAAVVGSSLVCTLAFSYNFGLWRTKSHFNLPWKEVAIGWLRPAAKMAAVLVPVTVITWLLTRQMAPADALVLRGAAVGTIGAWALFRWGLDTRLQQEMMHRLPPGLRRFLRIGNEAAL
jgi:O-antigen/teichoic acid export membrane protein